MRVVVLGATRDEWALVLELLVDLGAEVLGPGMDIPAGTLWSDLPGWNDADAVVAVLTDRGEAARTFRSR